MIRALSLLAVTGLVSCNEEFNTNETETTTRLWKRKKPAYWEFPITDPTEKPDLSAEYCKDVNMEQLGENITGLITKPMRGQGDNLLTMIVTYVLTLHRFIRKTNTTDDIAIRMAKDLIKTKRPQFLDMELDLETLNKRVGLDKYEFQHFKWVLEDIQNSWEKLKGILFGEGDEL
ncbi:uncharacterized protein LOC128995286 [Macrosteles quadrilineatus]|uniref:uncharacterized protein LOC128995286 n=1 Tax=Macrosteles quadrilineatus TaxID=74068 RepID=UPI0023E201E3|nr:uncharacterized protein LOC128995286 [Macrosteles quadrilineatus]